MAPPDQGGGGDDAPSRSELERALRHAHLLIENLRDQLLDLAAEVVALRDHAPDPGLVKDVVRARAESSDAPRVELAAPDDKYSADAADVPCAELIPICRARCCTLSVTLSSQDLNEGGLRWDYARPYRLMQREHDGYCVHSDADSLACTVYEERPSICRRYDCRNDQRIWADFAQRILAEPDQFVGPRGAMDASPEAVKERLLRKVRERELAWVVEETSVLSLHGKK